VEYCSAGGLFGSVRKVGVSRSNILCGLTVVVTIWIDAYFMLLCVCVRQEVSGGQREEL